MCTFLTLVGLFTFCMGTCPVIHARQLTTETPFKIKDKTPIERTKALEGLVVGDGKFNELSSEFAKACNFEDFKIWCKDKDPIIRAMGLACAAKASGPRAAKLLKDAYSDSTKVCYLQSGGCHVSETVKPICEVAWYLTVEPHRIDSSYDYKPCLPKDLLHNLPFEVLANDRLTCVYRSVDFTINFNFKDRDKFLASNLRLLCRKYPTLPHTTLMKALGRLEPNETTLRLLIQGVKNRRFTKLVRLTAASALTRYPRPRAINAIASCKELFVDADWFGQTKKLPVGDYLLYQAKTIKIVQEQYEKILVHSPFDDDLIEASITRNVIRTGHPALLRHACSCFFSPAVEADADVEKHFMLLLSHIAAKAKSYRQPWNTFSNTDYLGVDALDSILYFLSDEPKEPRPKALAQIKKMRKKFQKATDSRLDS